MNQPKGSFFDDIKLEMWTKGPVPLGECSIEGILLKMSKKGVQKPRQYRLCGDRLVCKQKQLVLNNIGLEKTQNNGFRLIRNKKCIDLSAQNEEAFELWYCYLKQTCVQRGFNNIYMINKLIGKGNFAKVYSATKKSDSKVYAVKAFDKLKFADLKIDKPALIKELAIMRLMDCRGVIKLYEVFENESYIFLVCEMLDGGELFTHMKGQKAYEEKQVALVMYRILQAIDYIHSKGILHRDIKPENLILRSKGDLTDVVIADFGLADFFNAKGDYMFRRCGTPGYVAPELLQDQVYDYKIDIFSAGILMFIMLSGQSPFPSNSYDEIVMKNYHCDIDYNLLNKHHVSPDAHALLRELLEKDPNLRISGHRALEHQWFKNQDEHILHLDGFYPRHNKNSELYCKTPLMNQELCLSFASTPQTTPQIRSKSNTADIYKHQDEIQQVKFRTPSQSQQYKAIAEENDYNLQEDDDITQGDRLKIYQIQPKLKKGQEEACYNQKEVKHIRDNLQTKFL